jgi:hypothetical protein
VATAIEQSLLDKLRDLPREKLAEVEDYVDFLRERQRIAAKDVDARLREAARAGRITLPAPGSKLSSVIDHPPIKIPGTPLSEIVIRDRR